MRAVAGSILFLAAAVALAGAWIAETIGKSNYGFGRLQVSVGPGLKVGLQKVLGDNPAALGSIRALVVNARGELFVFQVFGELHPSDGTPGCTVLIATANTCARSCRFHPVCRTNAGAA
jgi:hypothetical protein